MSQSSRLAALFFTITFSNSAFAQFEKVNKIIIKVSLIAIIVLNITVAQAQFQFRFEHIDKLQSGISGTNAMILDTRGFIWIGTGRGVYRYDGYNYRLFINDPDNKNNLTLNSVGCLFEDRDGKIWIGTGEGPVRFDPFTETFESFSFFSERIKTGMVLNSIVEDRHGNIWFTMQTDLDSIGGLVLFTYSTNSYEVFNFNGLLLRPRNISLDEHGNFWIASNKGIFIFDPNEKELVKQITSLLPSRSSSSGNVSHVYFEGNGIMWATSTDVGVSKIEYDQFYNVSIRNFQEKDGLMTNNISSMIKDARDNYWLTTMNGLIVLDLKNNNIANLRPSDENRYALKHWWCNSLLEDKSGVVWIGFNDHGISKGTKKGFISIAKDEFSFERIKENNITALYVDTFDNIWIALAGVGIHKINFQSDFTKKPKNSFFTHPVTWINYIAEDEHGNIIMAISDMGMCSLDQKTGEFKQLNPHGTSIAKPLPGGNIFLSDVHNIYLAKKEGSNYSVEEIIPDSSTRKRRVWPEYSSIAKENENDYWLTTWQGDLYYWNRKSNAFIIPVLYPKQSLRIIDVYIDSNKFLWITAFEGIFKFTIVHQDNEVKLNLIRKYTEKDGFISKSGASEIFSWSMEEDNHGNFWFKGVGISHLNLQSERLTNYYDSDGVIEGSTPMQGSSKLKSGHLVFATPEGAFLFHPDSLRTNNHIPPIEITNFTILNNQYLIPVKKRELKYFENVMTFEFSALDFTEPSKNQYAYQMVGFDQDWIYSGNRRTATYTNLDPGSYIFRVKGSNNDGVWNEAGTSIEIIILPPPWKTWWAYSLYAFAFIGLLVAARNEIVKRESLSAKARLKEMEAIKYHELDKLKSRFFANISHEFRTPLTLILAPLEKKLKEDNTQEEKAQFSLMHRSANRLLTLVNQLLDLSRLEAGTLTLNLKHTDLGKFITTITSQFASMADSKKINFQVNLPETIELFVDHDKLEKIITNLLSNAFKFTPSNGTIVLSISSGDQTDTFHEGYAEIKVSDTGRGIAAEHLDRIFDRFYQVDNSGTRESEGAGIGLALARELTELHEGTITVESEPGKGSTFIVRLPLGFLHLKADELTLESHPVNQPPEYTDYETSENQSLKTEASAETILVIEDNTDLRQFIRNEFGNTYTVWEAPDGEIGLNLAFEHIPTLIITDLMMPKRDGLELCQILKNDLRTSHIPIILLTAKADVETKLQGFQVGADEYIPKPFNMEELKVRIHNLVDNRKRLREKYAQRMELRPAEVNVESVEERFLKNIMEVVEVHIANSAFGVDQFAKETGMSQAQLYRKLHALTEFTPNEFIRHMRLLRAADLFRQKAGNVAEVAYQVGFNNLSYFAKCFKEKFSESPSQFLSRVK